MNREGKSCGDRQKKERLVSNVTDFYVVSIITAIWFYFRLENFHDKYFHVKLPIQQ